ncbi:MAG TPA: hypothetical protein VHX63_10255 [Acidobacteriaceae bacterium]|jgi:6-phospho-beta-glucosidase|nr:hypothetical protein [Acidobacteriaceae bacterium]
MTEHSNRKIALLGGGSVRTPLVAFGINESAKHLGAEEFVLYDPDKERVRIMGELCKALVAREGGKLRIRVAASLEDAISDATFILSSVRVGGIQTRATDERIAIDHGYPGQETTGPAGAAMALRTVPVAIEQARMVERLAPKAWLINFTNPAGLITQAILQHTGANCVGICDTPTELFHRIALALKVSPDEVRCDYAGLNHLGWVRRVWLHEQDVIGKLLADDAVLQTLFSTSLFDFDMLRVLGLIPTEYLFFYYSRRRALSNQRNAGSTRGEEVVRLNTELMKQLNSEIQSGNGAAALATYTDYLNQRSGSYMKLEGASGSAFDSGTKLVEDPFRAATGYHRIALDVMNSLCGDTPRRVVVNVRNHGAVSDVASDDIVEVPCTIANGMITPEACGWLPEEVRGLVLAVKAYERAIIEAAVTGSELLARKAMLLYPAIGEWEPSKELLYDFRKKKSIELH